MYHNVKRVAALSCLLVGCVFWGGCRTTVDSSRAALVGNPVLAQFALYAEQGIALSSGDTVMGGDIGVASLANTSTIQVASSATVDSSRNVFAATVSLASGASVGAVYTNNLSNSGGTYTSVTSLSGAVMPLLPLGQQSPGGAAVTVTASGSLSIVPGAYGAVNIGAGGTLHLASGAYTFTSVTLGNNAVVQSGANTTVGVSGSLTTGTNPGIGPTTGAASDLVITVSGNDATSPYAPVATIGTGSGGVLTALFNAPHGTLALGQGINVHGACSAFAITVGPTTHITYQTGLSIPSGPPVNTIAYQPIPIAVASSPIVGVLPQTAVMSVGLELPIANGPQFGALLTALYTPGNAQYHQFLTPSAFATQFESSATYAALNSWATSLGLTTTTYNNTRYLDVQGTVAQLAAAFGVNFYTYLLPSGGQFYASDRLPTMPAATPQLFAASGFNSFNQPPQQRPSSSAALSVGSGLNGAFLATDVRSLYAGGTTLNGTMQNLALVAFDDFDDADIQGYVNSTAPAFATLTAGHVPLRVPVLGGNAGPQTGNGQQEVTLDVDMALAMAPASATCLCSKHRFPILWRILRGSSSHTTTAPTRCLRQWNRGTWV